MLQANYRLRKTVQKAQNNLLTYIHADIHVMLEEKKNRIGDFLSN